MKFAQKMQTSRIKCKVVSHILGVCVCGVHVQVQPLNAKEVAVTTGVYVRSGLLGFVGNVSLGPSLVVW